VHDAAKADMARRGVDRLGVSGGGPRFPARAEFIACSLGGERGLSAISHPCGFRMRRGERRPGVLSRVCVLNILLSNNQNLC
jgi:hypothetical protein